MQSRPLQTVEFGPSGSLQYRVLFVDPVGGEEVSPLHGVQLYQGTTQLNFICKTPRGYWAEFEAAHDEPCNPLRLRERRREPSHFAQNARWHVGMLPQTWADGERANDEYGGIPYDNRPIDVIDIGGRVGRTGDVYPIKPLAAFAVIEEGKYLSWKVVAIDAADVMAASLTDITDVERIMPNVLQEIRDWLRTCHSITTGYPENAFGLNQRAVPYHTVMQIVAQAHGAWQLIQKKLGGERLGNSTVLKPSAYEELWAKRTSKLSKTCIPLSDRMEDRTSIPLVEEKSPIPLVEEGGAVAGKRMNLMGIFRNSRSTRSTEESHTEHDNFGLLDSPPPDNAAVPHVPKIEPMTGSRPWLSRQTLDVDAEGEREWAALSPPPAPARERRSQSRGQMADMREAEDPPLMPCSQTETWRGVRADFPGPVRGREGGQEAEEPGRSRRYMVGEELGSGQEGGRYMGGRSYRGATETAEPGEPKSVSHLRGGYVEAVMPALYVGEEEEEEEGEGEQSIGAAYPHYEDIDDDTDSVIIMAEVVGEEEEDKGGEEEEEEEVGEEHFEAEHGRHAEEEEEEEEEEEWENPPEEEHWVGARHVQTRSYGGSLRPKNKSMGESRGGREGVHARAGSRGREEAGEEDYLRSVSFWRELRQQGGEGAGGGHAALQSPDESWKFHKSKTMGRMGSRKVDLGGDWEEEEEEAEAVPTLVRTLTRGRVAIRRRVGSDDEEEPSRVFSGFGTQEARFRNSEQGAALALGTSPGNIVDGVVVKEVVGTSREAQKKKVINTKAALERIGAGKGGRGMGRGGGQGGRSRGGGDTLWEKALLHFNKTIPVSMELTTEDEAYLNGNSRWGFRRIGRDDTRVTGGPRLDLDN